MTLGELVTSKGIKQAWLADQLATDFRKFSAVCAGRQRIPVRWTRQLAELLGCEFDVIFDLQVAWEMDREARNGKTDEARRTDGDASSGARVRRQAGRKAA